MAAPPPPVVTINDDATYRRIYREQDEILDARRNAYQDVLDFGTEDQINATSKAWIDAIEASTAQDVELARYRASHPQPRQPRRRTRTIRRTASQQPQAPQHR